jgi:cytochrome c5
MNVHHRILRSAGTTLAASILACSLVPRAHAEPGDRSGREVVQTVCAACHATGLNGAPRIGDSQAWQKRAERGLSGLSQNALAGIRNMPPHGGNPGLTDIEIERAITYMVNASGGHWAEPIAKAALPPERTGVQIVDAYCGACHEAGVGGAPRIGDRAAWIPRATQGLDALTRSAINGHGGMPPRGGVANLTDRELRSAIGYMLYPGTEVMTARANAGEDRVDPNHHIVGATDIYFGVTSAESIRAQHRGRDAESMMHGATPRGRDYYHMTIALFDHTKNAPIADAKVEARVVGRSEQVKVLEPMVVNDTVSYGNYFRLAGSEPYTIVLTIRVPGTPGSIATQFQVQP